MKKNIIYAILFLCLIENKSYGQVTFIKEYSSPNGDRIKSNGIYQTNVANELAMTISNYDEGNTSILLLTRNGNIKNKATLKFKYDYAYISNLFFVQDTIYGCGNSTPVMQEATCSGSKPTGFYFKYVLNRSNPNNITGTFAWIKEDELLNSGEASVYYKIDAIRNDSLYMIGVLYQNHGGCTGSSKSAIVMINAKDGSKYSSNVSQSNSTVNFISKVDLLADRNSVFTTDQDWTDIFGSTHRYYNVLRKLNSSNLNIQDSIHFRGIGTGGNTLERHSFFFNSLFSEGSNDGSPNLITAYAAGMTQGLDSVIAICKISKSTLDIVQQTTFKLGENQLILSGQLMPKSNGYLMFVSTKPDKFATIPNLVRLIELDNNLNLINAYELTANLFSNHSTGAYAINNVVLIGNDLFLYTNKLNKIQLNRLDLSDTSSTCQKLSKINWIPIHNSLSNHERITLKNGVLGFPLINKTTDTTALSSTVFCQSCKINVSISSNMVNGVLKLSANVFPSIGNYSFNWYFNGSQTPLSQNNIIDAIQNGKYKLVIKELDFTNCQGSFEYTTLGVQKNLDAKSVFIYPNPTSELLNIEMDNYNEVKLISLIDATGKTVIDSKEISSKITTLNVQNLSKGIYILKISNLDNSISRFPIAVQ